MMDTILGWEDQSLGWEDQERDKPPCFVALAGFVMQDRVSKPKGYKFDGVVIGLCETLEGLPRVIVENRDRIVHIFAPEQLERIG